MLQIDVSNLRNLTNEAIERAKAEKEKQEKEEEAKREQQRMNDILRAESVIYFIPSICEERAKAGEKRAIVMHLEYGKDYLGNVVSDKNLIGSGKIVFEECLRANLNPSLKYWHSDDGMDSGWDIEVSWS